MMHSLVLGGIRSGKSALAEALAQESGTPVVYVATGGAGDGEMSDRIRQHRARRPAGWALVEEPLALAAVLQVQQHAAPCLLIDCMSLWVSNLLHAGDEVLRKERSALLDTLPDYPGAVVIVSNEVGLGTIGMDPLTRRFCDELGWLNQALAQRCERVVMSVAGLPWQLK